MPKESIDIPAQVGNVNILNSLTTKNPQKIKNRPRPKEPLKNTRPDKSYSLSYMGPNTKRIPEMMKKRSKVISLKSIPDSVFVPGKKKSKTPY